MQICSVSTTFNSLRDTRFLISTEVQEVKKKSEDSLRNSETSYQKKKKKTFQVRVGKACERR